MELTLALAPSRGKNVEVTPYH